jgi:hypothetical protein
MRDDALPIRRIVSIGAGIAAAVAVAIGVVLGMLSHRHIPVGGDPVAKPAQLGDDVPMLQTAPQLDLAAYRDEKSRELNQVGWVDAASGVAHVPIALAMAGLVEHGAASRPIADGVVEPAPLPAVSGHAASMPTAIGDSSPSGQAPLSATPASGASR